MPVNHRVAWKTMAVASVIAVAVGCVFPLTFFAFNDPDQVKFSAVMNWFAICLIPTAILISIKYRATLIVNMTAMLAGIYIGTCIALIVYYPDKANLFPIAAAIWTIVAAIPVACGGAIGFLITRIFFKQG